MSELANALRDLPARVLNVKVEERKELFENVCAVLSNPGINATIVRGICKVIGTTLTKYKDPVSMNLVKNLIVALIKEHPDLTFEHFNNVLKTIVTKDLATTPIAKASQAAVIALGWSVLITLNAKLDSDIGKAELPKLIESQAGLYQMALSSDNEKVTEKAYSFLAEMWKARTELEIEYFDKLLPLTPCTQVIILISAILRFKFEADEDLSLLEKNKTQILDHFVKGLITVKTKPHPNFIMSCRIILKAVDKDDFKTAILPALERSMLRSPEVILNGVGSIINAIEMDVSEYSVDIGKTLIQNLYSKDDTVRTDAVESLKQLSLKCSDAKSVETLSKQIFGVLNGSDGKITVAEYRINLYQGLGYLRDNKIAADDIKTSLLPTIVECFIKALENEIQEKVLCFALEIFGLWSIYFHNELPAKIIDIFKKGLDSKSQMIRTSYLQWFLCCLQNATLPTAQNFSTLLSKLVDKAAQNSTSIPIVTEGVSAACVLLLTVTDKDENNLSNYWNIVLDMNKQLFVAEKFLTTTPADTLCYIMIMIEKLLLNYYDKLKGPVEPLFKAIVYCLHNSSKKVRSYCLPILKRIIGSTDGINFAKQILQQLTAYIQIVKIHAKSEQASDDNSIPAQAFIDSIITICSSLPNIEKLDSETISLSILLCANHSALYATQPDLWEVILGKFNLNSKLFIHSKSSEIKELLFDNYKAIPMYENSISTVTKLNSDVILPIIINHITSEFNKTEMSDVTDDEYFTYLTPEGELYDKSVIPNSDEIYQTAHLKRENKAYSYKEQLEELQLRREIEEKKRKEGKVAKMPQLTPKQKEAIKNQTDKENAIKERLTNLNTKLISIVSQMNGAAKGNPEKFSLYYSQLLPSILQLFKSPLAATPLTELYYNLKNSCFKSSGADDDEDLIRLGENLAIATIRLNSPHCDLNEEWMETEINELCEEVLTDLYDMTVIKCMEVENKDENDKKTCLFNAPTFSYAFEFLKKALLLNNILNNETMIISGIHIIGSHAQIRGDTLDGSDIYHPKYLPRLEMLKFLFNIIKHNSGRLQTQAVAALLDVAVSSSGDDYRAIAGKGEVECLLIHLQSDMKTIRDVTLRALTTMTNILPSIHDDYNLGLKLIRRLWVAKHDPDDDIQVLAETLWENGKFEVPIVLCDELMKDVIHPELSIQKSAAASLVSLLRDDPSLVENILAQLLDIYRDKMIMIPAKLDQFDREMEPAIDQWNPRRGVAITICQIAQFFSPETVNSVMQFMVTYGLRDREEIVHKEMLAASLAIVDVHGNASVSYLLPVFEEFLDKAPKDSSYDNIRQAVVILMGSLARHLEKDDKRIQPIIQKLISALSTPSQQVQEAVANCIPHLIPSIKDQAPQIVKKLMHQLIKSEKYGERKGAAYGIAGVVKGLGILSLKQLDIMTKLTNHIQDKKNYKSREGALFAFEMLCHTLGRLFEPYIVHVLPHLLQCFGDPSQYVRQAADDTAKIVMGKLSAHGVKLVLPSLLNALDEDSWRTKTASVELLGAMAYCAPKQLSSCLPSIVPKLMEVLGDSHIKVQEAGGEALRVIGSVIKNPEIQAIVPILLRALEDPSNKTQACLQSLLDTKFVHFIDAPSLALIMPVVQRAFMDRSTETRKMAAQIIGNMYSLTDQKDLTPYLPNIIPGLKQSLLDPVPEVRAVSSRALGAMVRGMGESSFEDLLPWLMQTLTSESSSVDRSGAAQGLSEVVGGLGVEKLHKLMPEIIATAERTDIAPHVKDGYIMMFIYMPGAFPNDFTQYIGQIINPILKALADENEYVRDTALKAGQRIVNLYAETAITLLLPELEKGLFDDNWRIRYSSVQLLGDLLYRVSGVSGKMTTETASEDDNFGTEQSHKAIMRSLGAERRNRVLAGLYMGRSDVALMVRQAALHVWKVVVTNTPRTLREILPTLFGLLLGCLASTSYDKRQVAARTLGDLVKKLGERVLPEIIPILERGLNSEEADQRQGVCIGLSEIMASTSRDMVLTFVNSLVPTVRKALSDPLPEVRHAAAKTFESLHTTVGARALDDILPSMLEGLSDPDPQVSECTLDGLRQVMAIKSRVVLPYLIPQLTSTPVNTKALSILASVAGEALTKYLPKILPALLSALAAAQGKENEAKELEYCQAVILSVSDEIGVRTIMDTLMESTKTDKIDARKAAATLLCAFCTHSPGDYSQYVPQLLRGLLVLLADEDKDVLQKSWDALNAVTKTLDSAEQIAHVTDVRQAVKFATSDLKGAELPGFCLPKGITPLLPVFREAILNGLPEEKENAAQGLGEVIQLTSAASLQPSVVHITGPLIRILGDRFNAGVKAAVLETLAILLNKVGIMLKQFLPQLQTTFLKALHDPNRIVRMKAGYALAKLLTIHIRPDPLFLEMHNGIKSTDDPTIRETMLQGLRGLITPSGDKMSEPLRKQIFITLLAMLGHAEDITRSSAAGCLGALCKWLTPEQLDEALSSNILNQDFGDDDLLKHGRTAALFVALKECPEVVYNEKYEIKICKTIVSCITSDKPSISANGVRAGTYLLEYCLNESVPLPQIILQPYIRAMNHNSNDVKQLLAKSCAHISKTVPPEKTSNDLLRLLIPMLVNGTKEKSGYVKSNSEIALIAVLRLRAGEEFHQKCVNLLESGAKDSLNDVVSKVLRKVALQPAGKEEELDDTILS